MKKRNAGGDRPDEEPGDDGDSRQLESLTVVAIAEAKEEAKAILNDNQYWEAVLLVKRLVDFGNQKATADLSIRQFGNFWELRLKGGFLKRLNLRIYFAFVAE